MKKFYPLLLFFFISNILQAQKFDWIEKVGGPRAEDAYDITLYKEYVYVVGRYTDSIVFPNNTIVSKGIHDAFLLKYDTLGNFYWAKSFGGEFHDASLSMDVDGNGNIYVAGYYSGSVAYFDSLQINGQNAYVAKYDSTGTLKWAKLFGPSGFDVALTCIGNNVYIYCGHKKGNIYYDGSVAINSKGNFLFKLNSQGKLIWSKTLGQAARSNFLEITSDPTNPYLYIAGNYEGNAQIDTYSVASTGYEEDTYIAKLDTSGNVYWLNTTSDSTNTYVQDLTVDQFGDVFVLGQILDEWRMSSYLKWDTLALRNGRIFLLKLKSNGEIIYGKIYGGNREDYYYYSRLSGAIDIAKDKSIYITTSFYDTLVLNGRDYLFSKGKADILLMKLDSLANLEWAQQAGGAGDDDGLGIIADERENVFVTGVYAGLSTFGSFDITSVGLSDLFLVKFAECKGFSAGISSIGDSTSCTTSQGSSSIRLNTYNSIGYSFQWLRNQEPIAYEISPDLFPTQSGHYSVIVNFKGCIDTSRSIYVTFDTVPPVSIHPFDTICLNSAPILLSAASPSGGHWTGNGVDSSYFHPSIAGVGPSKITYTYSNGQCSDSAFQYIYVKTSPMPSISGQKMVCTNSAAYSYSVSGASGLSYQWSASGGNIISGQGTASVKVEWGSPGIGILELMAVSSGNSQCDTSIVQDSIYISGQKINADIFGADSVCANISYKYSTQALGLLYQWQVKGGQIVSGSNTSFIEVVWDKVSQGTLYLRVFNACYSDTIVRDTVAINSIPKPQIVGSTQHCAFTSKVPYTAISAANSYSWSIHGGNLVSGQGTDSILVDWGGSAQGKIVLTETGSNGCSDTAQLNVQLLTVPTTVLNESICSGESFFFNGQNLGSAGNYSDTLTGTNGCDSLLNLTLDVNQVNINVNVSNDTLMAQQAGGSYQWLSCNGGNFVPLSGDTSRILTAVQTGKYAVAIEKENCKDTSACIPFVTVGMNDKVTNYSWKLFPNPSHGLITVEAEVASYVRGTMILYSMHGKKLLQKDFVTQKGKVKMYLNLMALSKGIYLLKIKSENAEEVLKKVVIN